MDVVIIGAGIAGLAAALRLSHAGRRVDVFETHGHVGGKIRTLPTQAGPVDAGPTVLTMRAVFDDLFADVGETLDEHLTLVRQDLLARHFWSDGKTLDLFDDAERNKAEITRVFGARSGKDYERFHQHTKLLFDSFEAPMMYESRPSQMRMNTLVMRNPALFRAMAPHRTMAQNLSRQFKEPQLAQLFGRYATYVGGSPYKSPSLLSLIWQAESGGVWQAKGGMEKLALTLRSLAEKKGAQFHLHAHVTDICTRDGAVNLITLADGAQHRARVIVYNGDPAALSTGRMGHDVAHAVTKSATSPRSHSANVWSFAAIPSRQDLSLHNIFFGLDAAEEFGRIDNGRNPTDPTLYVYAQDRGGSALPTGPERFEIILNAPPTGLTQTPKGDYEQCRKVTFSTLESMGLTFSPTPDSGLTTPAMFNQLFPASEGALYGRSPHGLTAAFKRPTARTKIKGLYLAGGGCHPGAGIPMATLSAKHAAEAILSDQTSTSTSRQTAMHGGTSTASPTTAPTRSPSSAS